MHPIHAFLLHGILVLSVATPHLAGADSAPAKPGGFVSSLFNDHMVIQRGRRIPVWGWTTPKAQIAVSLAGNAGEAVAGADGKWMAWLPPLPAGGPHTLQITGPEQRTVKDVLVGDVWICSGQSNMAWTVASSNNAKTEIEAGNFPQLRQLAIDRKIAVVPMESTSSSWTVASPATVGRWTAVGYFFGRELLRTQNVPIGLINSSWGGTRVEAWTSREVLAALPGTETDLAALDQLVNTPDLASRRDESQRAWDEAKARLLALEQDAGHQQRLAAPDFDDRAWAEIKAPATWDSQGHSGVKGEAWYRKEIEVPQSWAGKDLELSPGAADEIETSFFNGVKVGSTGSLTPPDSSAWNKQRTYAIPAALVKPGRSVIAIRVVNLVGEGGLRSNGDPAFMFLRPAGSSEAKERISLAGSWRFDFAVRMVEPLGTNPNLASGLFNGMINPLIPFPITGVIWYQGESNAGNAFAYRERFPAMINDWRGRWGGGDFPFLWVQLANFRDPMMRPTADNWAVVRESQDLALGLPNTGTAITIDVGDSKDIHPRDKQTVGLRLALAARALAYGEKLVYSGPRYAKITIEGPRIRLGFDHVGGGLVARDGELKRFAVAGADRVFTWAQAKIEGETVVVWSDQVPEPKAVRYAFETNPEGANLYNHEGLPASPFRTDDWPVPTQPTAGR